MSHKSEWFSYILGALLTLAYKYARYIYASKKASVPMRQATLEWFLEPSRENGVSWAASIGAVWVCGSLYIDKAIQFTGITELPVIHSVAFTLGALAEQTAPAIAKWIAAKLPKQD